MYKTKKCILGRPGYSCPVHHLKKQPSKADANFKAEQEKRLREETQAQTTGLRALSAIVEAIPVRLMKRDLLCVAERLSSMLDERRLALVLSQHYRSPA